jgi:hypothetical protein
MLANLSVSFRREAEMFSYIDLAFLENVDCKDSAFLYEIVGEMLLSYGDANSGGSKETVVTHTAVVPLTSLPHLVVMTKTPFTTFFRASLISPAPIHVVL